jgi:hypothetical protein
MEEDGREIDPQMTLMAADEETQDESKNERQFSHRCAQMDKNNTIRYAQ